MVAVAGQPAPQSAKQRAEAELAKLYAFQFPKPLPQLVDDVEVEGDEGEEEEDD